MLAESASSKQHKRPLKQGKVHAGKGTDVASGESTDLKQDRRAQLQKARRDLPIYKAKAQILDALKANDTLILVGETGLLSRDRRAPTRFNGIIA
jgi:HrpA-like RNA helicase